MSTELQHALNDFMAQVTDEMAAEYERIYRRSTEDPGTAGDEGEENWAHLLREWLPSNYHVRTKGRLLAHDGRASPQIDIVVLKPSYPQKLLDKKLYLANGVMAAFECKNTLKAADVEASVERCSIFKSLYAPRTGSPFEDLRSPLIYGILSHSYAWKGPNSTPIDNVQGAFDRSSILIKEPRLLVDLICVADLACWNLMCQPYYDLSWAEPNNLDDVRAFVGGNYCPMTSLNCANFNSESQKSTFRPIGSLVSYLTDMIAKRDPSVRDMADYYRLAGMWGSGARRMRPWPISSLSAETQEGIAAGRLRNGAYWDGWTFVV